MERIYSLFQVSTLKFSLFVAIMWIKDGELSPCSFLLFFPLSSSLIYKWKEPIPELIGIILLCSEVKFFLKEYLIIPTLVQVYTIHDICKCFLSFTTIFLNRGYRRSLPSVPHYLRVSDGLFRYRHNLLNY
ncbi:unnamed protein product [Ilex paraguariensis]|uniref:Uncharacterized protein n=1 Tax=Ilex paraguariensis TaxID=185542 RepID=A0ABC8TYN1_9AQUA